MTVSEVGSPRVAAESTSNPANPLRPSLTRCASCFPEPRVPRQEAMSFHPPAVGGLRLHCTRQEKCLRRTRAAPAPAVPLPLPQLAVLGVRFWPCRHSAASSRRFSLIGMPSDRILASEADLRCSGATRGHLMAVGKTAPDPAGTVPREQRAEPACACVARVVFATRQRAVAPRRSPRHVNLRLPLRREKAGVRVGNLATATARRVAPTACISRAGRG